MASGAPGVTYGDNGWVTTNMLGFLRAAGYKIISDRDKLQSDVWCVRGAIYVSEGHTICALGNGSRAGETLRAAGLTEEPAVVVIPDPLPGPDTDAAVAAPSVDTCRLELPVLRRGDASPAVEAAQLLLIARGYTCGPWGADGDFGAATFGAVYRFQQAHGIQVDGIIGPETWRKLICD